MARRDRTSGSLIKLAAFLIVASLLAVPMSQAGARQQDNEAVEDGELGRPSQALIAQELESGKIDYETSLVYRAYALFDDPRLPADLAGTGSFGEDHAFFGEAHYNWSNLSPDTQALLTPFVVRPTDSRSIFYESLANGKPRVVPELSGPVTYADGTCTDNWISKDSAQFPFKVWTHCTGDYDADLDAAIAMVDDFWERLVALMGPPILDTGSAAQGGDTRIDIYFVDDEADRVPRRGGDYISESALAHAAPDEPRVGRGSSGYIVARRPNIGDSALILTMAHEFFHTLQQAHNWEIAFGFKGTPYDQDFETLSFSEFWFVEATATWVMSYLYRDRIDPAVMQLSVHYRFVGSFQGAGLPLYHSPRQWAPGFDHMYGAYIYFLFLEQEVGPEAIAQMWKDLEDVEPDDFNRTLEIINDILPFEENFREFAVRNLNLDLQPGDPISPSYKDLDPTFLEGFAPPLLVGDSPASRIELDPGRDEPLRFDDPIPSLSANYYNFDTPAAVTRLTFDFTGLAPNEAVDVDVVTKIRGEGWERRQIDPSQPITFCREIPEDALSFFYLVISNHDMEEANTVRGTYTVTADEVPCAEEETP